MTWFDFLTTEQNEQVNEYLRSKTEPLVKAVHVVLDGADTDGEMESPFIVPAKLVNRLAEAVSKFPRPGFSEASFPPYRYSPSSISQSPATAKEVPVSERQEGGRP